MLVLPVQEILVSNPQYKDFSIYVLVLPVQEILVSNPQYKDFSICVSFASTRNTGQ